MNERKIYFGIEKRFWIGVGVLLAVFILTQVWYFIGVTITNRDLIFNGVILFLVCVFLVFIARQMTNNETEFIERGRQEAAAQEKIAQSAQKRLTNFVATKFKPVGEIVFEGDYPDLTASFNDQSGTRHQILMVGKEFYEKVV